MTLSIETIKTLTIWYYCSNEEKSQAALAKLQADGIDPDAPEVIEGYVNTSIQFKA